MVTTDLHSSHTAIESAFSRRLPPHAEGTALRTATFGRWRVRSLLLAALFCALTIVGAYIRVPLVYVPLTLQTFFVLLSGMMLGPFYGPLSQVGYLLLGLAGLPVFSQGGGLAYIFKPTFGYLLGYPLGSRIVGKLLHAGDSDRGLPERSTQRLLVAGAAGMLAILVPGVVLLYLNLHFLADSQISWSTALWSGLIIFLPGDAFKLAGAIVVYRFLQRYRVSPRDVPQAH